MTEWTCAACHEPQVCLGSQAPPADLLCHPCRAERAPRPSLGALLAGAGVPSDFRRYATREAWMGYFHRLTFSVGDWPSEVDRWLCLWGPTGTGKTSAATVLLAEHLARGGRGLWIDGMSLLDKLAAEMDAGGERVVLPPLMRTPLLVLDEPFSGYLTDYAAGRMLLLIRRRDQDGSPTIVTSQLDPETLVGLGGSVKRNGEPLYPTGSLGAAVSRVLSGRVVQVDGPDERLARAVGGAA
jgi:hypothetical protein